MTHCATYPVHCCQMCGKIKADCECEFFLHHPDLLPVADGPAKVIVVDPDTGEERVAYDSERSIN